MIKYKFCAASVRESQWNNYKFYEITPTGIMYKKGATIILMKSQFHG